MRRPNRPLSAGAQGKRGPSVDARPASRDRKDASGAVGSGAPPPTSVRAGSRQRPFSAQAQREVQQARREAVNAEKALEALQEQILDLKKTGNGLTEENTKARTRLRVLERELQKRDKLLRQLAAIKKAGQGVDTDIIEKLREERNTLPLVRKKAQDLAQLVEQKDQEIKELKRDPLFTRIIELQVEYATWQHEAKRLQHLMQEGSPVVSAVARQEIDVHEKRVGQLENDLSGLNDRKSKVASDLQDDMKNHAASLESYQQKEKELQEEQERTRELAVAFKKILQDRKQVEKMQDEIEQMKLTNQKYEQELAGVSSPRAVARKAPLGRTSVSQAAMTSALPESQSRAASVLRSLRCATLARAGSDSLFAEFLHRDTDKDGLLSDDEVRQALAAVGLGALPPEDIATLMGLAPATVGESSSHQRCRWLDLLLLLDRSSGSPPPLLPPLPPLGPLRAACLRREIRVEEFHSRLCATLTSADAEAFFAGLGLESSVAAAWRAAWQAYGPDGLLLKLPIGEVAIDQAEFEAWFLRCANAARKFRKDLVDAFTQVWREDMICSQEQFEMVCRDVLGLELSGRDVTDLALFLSGGGEGPIDGNLLLRIDELRQPYHR